MYFPVVGTRTPTKEISSSTKGRKIRHHKDICDEILFVLTTFFRKRIVSDKIRITEIDNVMKIAVNHGGKLSRT